MRTTHDPTRRDPMLTTWSEAEVLDYFWAAVRDDADRIALLRQLAAVRLRRPSDWDEKWIRQAMHGVTLHLTGDRCFACRTEARRVYWHHVIQVQHGGSNYPRNLVPLCHRCHRDVHPWLPEPTTVESRGLTRIGDMALRVMSKLFDVWESRMRQRQGGRRGDAE